jgi:alcohol dehydrogenase class IV
MPETVRPAFADRPRPLLSYGIPFPAAAAHHVVDTFGASKIYIICSGSLARNTDALDRLTTALGPEKVVGRRIGMQSHTLWSEVLEIVHDARRVEADLLLTLGAGSLTDGAKVAALVIPPRHNQYEVKVVNERRLLQTTCRRLPTWPL